MRVLERNKQSFYYCLYEGSVPITDSNGYETGERRVTYSPPVQVRAVITPASGESVLKLFGRENNYDKIIITDNIDLPIDENSVLFIDKPPCFDEDSSPQNDYIIKRVAKSLNSIAYACTKV